MSALLKSAELRAVGKAQPIATPIRSSLVAARAPASRRHQAFKAAVQRGTSVRTAAAAEDDAAPAPTAAAATSNRAPKLSLASLKTGEIYEGTVTKVDTFGAFVNFGAERDGLVHVSQLSNKFVKSAASVVTKGDVVRVKLMSVDMDAGRVALSMKGLREEASGADDEDNSAAAEEEEEEEEAGEEVVEDDTIEAREGMELVFVDEEPDLVFEMVEDDPNMTLESVAAFEALNPEEIERVYQRDVMPVPLGELISGQVTRVEDYGAFVEFHFEGKKYTALLERDEAKVPSAALSPEKLAKLVPAGEEAPEYVDMDIETNLSNYYKPGDSVQAFVLEYTDFNKINLTQWSDWELDVAAKELPEEEYIGTVEEEADPLSLDPFSLMSENVSGSSDAGEGQAEDSVTQDLRAEVSMLSGFSRPLINQNIDVTFPSRPLKRISAKALNQPVLKDTDFDGDEIELVDLWQESFTVPSNAMRRLGLRFKYSEEGDVEVVEKEGAKIREFSTDEALTGNHNARVAAFVKDLLAADEDEAEVPARAMRRPVVLAAAVQNISASAVKDLRTKTGAGMMDCKKALLENDCDTEKAIEWLRKKGLAGADKKAGRVAAEGAVATYIHPGSRLGVLLEVNCETDFVAAGDKFQSLVGEIGMIIASCPEVICVSADEVPAEVLAKEREVEMGKEDIKSKPEAMRAKIVEGRIQKARDNMALINQASLRDPNKTVSEIIKESIAATGENIQVRRFVRYNLGDGLEKRNNDFAAEVAQQTQAKAAAPAPAPAAPKVEEAPKEVKPVVQVSAAVVKQLRDKTGAGMMDCKKALAENNNDIEVSVEWLRKKGLASADKKAGRLAAEGAIASYIHPGSRLGVLLEVNCETDFVAASETFNTLVNSIAMQIAASPNVAYVSAEDIPAEVFEKEKLIEMGREDLKGKPDAIRAKIAEGRVAKLGQEMALLPQPFLVDPSKTVEQAVKEAIAALGEKISVRRFVKYQLGEGIEKKESNLAADVAAMAGGK